MAVQISDLRGLAQLAIEGVLGVTQIVQGMHQNIRALPGPLSKKPSPKAAPISNFVYSCVRGVTRAVGKTLDVGLNIASPKVPALDIDDAGRDAWISALNGVWGDHLAASHNPLALPMQLRVEQRAIDTASWRPSSPQPLLLMLHGLCLNDLHWQRAGHDHGQKLAEEFFLQPIYLRYNTGKSVVDNGAELATLLQRLLSARPGRAAGKLYVLAHSMGGLVIRSALAQALAQGLSWPQQLEQVVCLGTPHAGAPLERAGAWFDRLIARSPYTSPLFAIGASRSSGIKDLAHGRILALDEPPPPPFEPRLYAVAGTRKRGERLLGDGLVSVASALGGEGEHSLHIPLTQRATISGCDHFELLSDTRVYQQLRRWLAAPLGATLAKAHAKHR